MAAMETGLTNRRRACYECIVFLVAVQYDLISQEAKKELIPAAKKRDVGVIAGTPFRQGVMVSKKTPEYLRAEGYDDQMIRRAQAIYRIADETGISLVELSIRYLISDPDVDCVAIGAQTAEQLDMNVEALKKGPLSADILDEIEKAGSAGE